MDVNGTAALVTGGGGGLGAATARLLAKKGAQVALLDVKADMAEAVAREIGGLAVACDVTDARSAEQAVAEAAAKHGAARVLVNCAGVAPAKRIVGKDGPMPLEEFRRAVEINLIGSFNLMRLAAAGMQTLAPLPGGDRGVIVSTASVAAYEGQVGQAAYAASKGGIVALTLPAAREFASIAVRVNAIAPGLFATPMLLGMPQAVQDSLAASVPYPKRFGTPDEFAHLVLHIVENGMINGECIRLDGAIRMQPR